MNNYFCSFLASVITAYPNHPELLARLLFNMQSWLTVFRFRPFRASCSPPPAIHRRGNLLVSTIRGVVHPITGIAYQPTRGSDGPAALRALLRGVFQWPHWTDIAERLFGPLPRRVLTRIRSRPAAV